MSLSRKSVLHSQDGLPATHSAMISRKTTCLAKDPSHNSSPTASYGCELWDFYPLDVDARAQRAALAQQQWQILKQILGVRYTICTDIFWQEVPVKRLDAV